MRKILLIAAAALLTLTACGEQQTPEQRGPWHLVFGFDNWTGNNAAYSADLVIHDGRTVTCIAYAGSSLSCDWDHAKPSGK